MAVNGKNKGNGQERKLSNLLSARFASLTGITQAFRRNPDSGSFFGASNQKRKDTHDLTHAHFGDIICPDNFKFAIESKFYKTAPSFVSIVKGKITQWDEWLAQASQDATNSKKAMMLIVKYNGTPEICFFDEKIVGIPLLFVYNEDKYVYRLSDVLTLADSMFFTLV
jgi:hypothetical protein